MKSTLTALVAVLVGSSFALADTPVSPANAEKIKATLQAWGCSGGKMEQETEGTSVYDARKDGLAVTSAGGSARTGASRPAPPWSISRAITARLA